MNLADFAKSIVLVLNIAMQASLGQNEELRTPPEPVALLAQPALDTLQIDIRPKMGEGSQGAKIPANIAAQEFGDYSAAVVDNEGKSRSWAYATFGWDAPAYFHRPLYFEQRNLERYGQFHHSWHIESALSAAHFFSTIPTLPYRMGVSHPCQRNYTQHSMRPGSCNPHRVYRLPKSKRGTFWQGIVTTGLIFAI